MGQLENHRAWHSRFAAALALVLTCLARPPAAAETVDYEVVANWPQLPDSWTLGDVAGVAIDSHNHVFVFHRGDQHPIFALDAESGRVVSSFGEGLFLRPHGLAVDGDDHVWVTDTGRHQVLKFSHDGELLMTLGERGIPGLDDAHFNEPTDVAVTPAGEIYVSDGYGNSRIAMFSGEGRFLLDWGEKGSEPGQFDLPHGITLDDQGNVYVADRSNARIQVFDPRGRFLRQWRADQLGKDGRPWGLEFAHGHLYVIDGGDMNPQTPDVARLTLLGPSGEVVARWSCYGRAPGQLLWGHDVTVGADGAVFTAEVRDNDRAQKFVRTRGR